MSGSKHFRVGNVKIQTGKSIKNNKENKKWRCIKMIMNNNFSSIIQTFMVNEINLVINKYSNIEQKKLEYVEALISKVDGAFKEELLQDFNKALKLATEIGESDVDNFKINVFLWIKNNSNLELSISEVIKYIEAVEEEGYISIDEGIIIYKKDSDLKFLARQKLENMLDQERFVDKLLDKDSLIEYWMNGTSKD